MENYFSYFSTVTYVVGTQKDYLNETVLMSTQKHVFKLKGKKITTILRLKCPFLNLWPSLHEYATSTKIKRKPSLQGWQNAAK